MEILKNQSIEIEGIRIDYDRIIGSSPGILFLGGFTSSRNGLKSEAFWDFCKENGRSFIRFDYSGHGTSGGEFRESTIGRWKNEALAVLDQLTQGPQVVVASSMGGWLGLHMAVERPERVKALIGVATAADMTKNLIEASLTEEARKTLDSDGEITIELDPDLGGTPITRTLVEEGRNHLLLGGPIEIGCPVHLLHGLFDEDVPWETSLEVMRGITGDDVHLEVIKSGDHRLSSPSEIKLLIERASKFLG